jgi:hypothetical protein
LATVKIIQLATPNIDGYARYSIASVRKYSAMHEYEYYVQRSQTLDDLHINWTKLDTLLNIMENSPEGDNSYTVLIDADIVITNPSLSIEYFIERYQKEDSVIFMANDTPFRLDFKKIPNAGFVIVRNNKKGQSILRRWIHAAYNEGKKYRGMHPPIQLVYWNCIEPKIKEQQVVLPGSYFHKPLWWVPKPPKKLRFLYHITSTDGQKRQKLMQRFYLDIWNDNHTLEEVDVMLNKQQDHIIRVN